MNPNQTNADKSITDKRLCLHHNLNKDMNDHKSATDDNKTIVNSTVDKSVKWTAVEHRIRLQRSISAESVLMAASYQLVGSLTAHTFCHRTDRFTQTPEEWEESDKTKMGSEIKEHKTESVQNKADAQQRASDQKLVSNKDQSTQITECDSYKSTQVLITSGVSPTKSTKSGPIAIPRKLCVDSSRSANSIEELNQEIENLVLKGIGGYGGQLICDKVPEGHRAPVFELLAIKANHVNRVGSSGEDSSDLSQSNSPIFVTEAVSSTDANEVNCCSSPKINKFLTREPPDGCEKIKIVNEDDRINSINIYPSVVRPVQSSGFVLLPSRSSAFLPIFKPNDLSDCLNNRINYRKI